MTTEEGMRSDIEIARAAKLKPIAEVAGAVGIPEEALYPYGRWIAKIEPDFLREAAEERQDGKLILVTAISPTPAGEGKTTTTVGLGDALTRSGKKAIVCLREPSLGPCFGMKGGAAGGGYAQVVPMDAINLHFTGDFHAITSAHNLLAAMVDNHIYWGNGLGLDQRRIAWRRVLDMNDRALEDIETQLPLHRFPSPDVLWERYKIHRNIKDAAEPLALEPYCEDPNGRQARYYQAEAINRTVEAVAAEQRRVLLVMATGTGKTYTTFQIIWRLWKAGRVKRALFLADRNILIDQAMNNDFKPFGPARTKVTDTHSIRPTKSISRSIRRSPAARRPTRRSRRSRPSSST